MVPRAGLEPAQRERRGILNPLCLPIPPPGHAILIAWPITEKQNTIFILTIQTINTAKFGGASRSRTEVHGFAIRCIATLPRRHFSS